jgi:superfamily I DNA/RNA helicase
MAVEQGSLDEYGDTSDDSEIIDGQPSDQRLVRVIGGPGSGKTSLIAGLDGTYKGVVNNLIDDGGYDPDSIYVTSFSRSQTADLESELNGVLDSDNVRTVDSLMYHTVFRRADDIITGKSSGKSSDYPAVEEFRSEYLPEKRGEELKFPDERGFENKGSTICGDIYQTHEYLTSSCLDINYRNILMMDVDPEKHCISTEKFVELVKKFRKWLKRNEEYDTFAFIGYRAVRLRLDRFSDMECLIVDESQDLSDIQIKYIRRLINQLDVCVTIRDDDQSIYSYKSENVGKPILRDPDEIIRQTDSYRCSEGITDFATALADDFNLGSARNRTLMVNVDDRGLDKIVPDMSSRNYLGDRPDLYILARTRRHVAEIEKQLVKSNIYYRPIGKSRRYRVDRVRNIASDIESVKDDRTDDLNVLDVDEKLDKPLHYVKSETDLDEMEYQLAKRLSDGDGMFDSFDIRVGTMHSAKGLESNSVLLIDDWTSKRDPMHPEERRIAYVAATRARDELRVTSLTGSNQNTLLRSIATDIGSGE